MNDVAHFALRVASAFSAISTGQMVAIGLTEYGKTRQRNMLGVAALGVVGIILASTVFVIAMVWM